MRRDGHVLSPAAKSSVIHFCNKKPREFRMNQLKMIIAYLPTFLETLEWIDTIKKLIVSCKAAYGGHELMHLMAEYIPGNPNIESIVSRAHIR